MAVLPQIRRLVIEDYKSQQAWIGPLLLNINSFMDGTFNALNKSLTIAQNTTSDIKTVTLSAVPSTTAPVSISWTKTSTPIAVHVGNVTRVDGTSFTLTASVGVQWYFGPFNNTTVNALQLTNVVGITPTTAAQYNLQLIVFTG